MNAVVGVLGTVLGSAPRAGARLRYRPQADVFMRRR